MGALIKSLQVNEQHALVSPFASSPAKPVQPLAEPAAIKDMVASPAKPQGLAAATVQPEAVAAPVTAVPVVDEAEREKLMAQWQEEARSQGFKQGYEAGQAKAQDETAELLQLLGSLEQKSQLALGQQLDVDQGLMASIIFEAVCKILGEKLVTPEGCRDMLVHVLRGVAEEDIIAIKLAPRDLEKLKPLLSQPPLLGLKLEADASVAMGGCNIKLREGLLDARLETQLNILAQTLRELVEHDGRR